MKIDDIYFGTLTPNATLVVKDDHSISGWGPRYSYAPVPLEYNHNIAMLHPGFRFAVALRTDHAIFAWKQLSTGGELKITDAERKDVTDLQILTGWVSCRALLCLPFQSGEQRALALMMKWFETYSDVIRCLENGRSLSVTASLTGKSISTVKRVNKHCQKNYLKKVLAYL